ncbi:MAG: hypothetical protein HFG96_06605 [Lachnospiraceae bacterium]|nr:hypothetical protein [Lachnospiraceae bacterium]
MRKTKRGEMLTQLFLFCMFIVAYADLCYQIFKKKTAAKYCNRDACCKTLADKMTILSP